MDYLQQLITRYPQLKSIEPDIKSAFEILSCSFSNGGKLLIAGNGGSSADGEHIVGELMKGFAKKRSLKGSFIGDLKNIDNEIGDYLGNCLQRGLPALSLSSHASLNFAVINDIDGYVTFAQQVNALGKSEDVFLGISTSGNAMNIRLAAVVAQAKKMKTIALTGGSGGELKRFSDVSIIAPETETYKIQELHLPIYHCLCLMLEDHFF